MLAGSGANSEQALFGLLQLVRIEIQRIQRTLDPRHRIGQLGERAAKGFDRSVQRALGLVGDTFQPTDRIAHRAFGTVIAK